MQTRKLRYQVRYPVNDRSEIQTQFVSRFHNLNMIRNGSWNMYFFSRKLVTRVIKVIIKNTRQSVFSSIHSTNYTSNWALSFKPGRRTPYLVLLCCLCSQHCCIFLEGDITLPDIHLSVFVKSHSYYFVATCSYFIKVKRWHLEKQEMTEVKILILLN